MAYASRVTAKRTYSSSFKAASMSRRFVSGIHVKSMTRPHHFPLSQPECRAADHRSLGSQLPKRNFVSRSNISSLHPTTAFPPRCLPATITKMSDEQQLSPRATPTAPTEEPRPAATDTSRSVTTSQEEEEEEEQAVVDAADTGPNTAAPTASVAGHETLGTPPPATDGNNVAAEADPAGGAPTGGGVGTCGGAKVLPFVAPSSYLRPIGSGSASSPSRARGSDAASSSSAAGLGLSAGRQMAVRKASNPVEREQIEGLVSLSCLLSFPACAPGLCVCDAAGRETETFCPPFSHIDYEDLWLTVCYREPSAPFSKSARATTSSRSATASSSSIRRSWSRRA